MPEEVAHDGCWNCGSTDEPILKSRTIYKIIDKKGNSMAPHSIATCSKPECMAIDEIDLRKRGRI